MLKEIRKMIILRREPVPRKKGYFKILIDPSDEERNESREYLQELFPGIFEGPIELLISEEVLFRRSLLAGSQIDGRELAELLAEDDLVKAKDIALRYLDYKMRTVREMEQKLKESGFSAQVIDATIASIQTYGFLDDPGYAKLYSKERIRQRGSRIIEQELAQKGIDKEVAQELLSDMKDAEYEAALLACRKKVQSFQNRGLEPQQIKDKVYRFLISRGYEYDLIKRVYNVTLDQTNEEMNENDSFCLI